MSNDDPGNPSCRFRDAAQSDPPRQNSRCVVETRVCPNPMVSNRRESRHGVFVYPTFTRLICCWDLGGSMSRRGVSPVTLRSIPFAWLGARGRSVQRMSCWLLHDHVPVSHTLAPELS